VPLRNDEGEISGLFGMAQDITERKKADALREGQARILEMIARSAPLQEVLTQLMYLIEAQLTGIYGSILLLDKDGAHLRHGAAPRLAPDYLKAIDGSRIGPGAGSCGTAVHRREAVITTEIMSDPLWDGYRDLAAAHGYRSCWSTPVLSHQGEVLGVFAMYSRTVREPSKAETNLIEITTRLAGIAIERKQAEERIHYMANHDALTGLPNRVVLGDRLEQAIRHARHHDRWVTVVFLDLDNFKFVNDSLGHSAGDGLLMTVANRMLASVRDIDTVVRLGGDEFVILLSDQPRSVEHVSQTLQKIRSAISEPVDLQGHRLKVTCSIGIANYPEDGMTADTLLANADAAMYRAKYVGRDNFLFYAPEFNAEAHEKLVMQKDLQDALANAELSLRYQPQVDLRTNRIFATEALARWHHPTKGSIPPDRFIPVAEETGLILRIGDWVLHEACRQNRAWQDAGLPPMAVCVNVSARQFKERNLADRVVSALRESGLEARYLELELTESLIMQDVNLAIATMKELQGLGVQLSIDDFGTGYSSLSALKTFPVTRLKIDKSFIDDLATNANDRAVAGAIISLAQKLNLRVTAEGVETDEQVAFLRDNNCHEMQGYRFSKPVPSADIHKLLKGPRPWTIG
jgi:diguanylate cyclase (GGDEF)-like protein